MSLVINFFAKVICACSISAVLFWMLIIGQSTIPLFSNSIPNLMGYQMNGNDLMVLEFRGGFWMTLILHSELLKFMKGMEIN